MRALKKVERLDSEFQKFQGTVHGFQILADLNPRDNVFIVKDVMSLFRYKK